MKNAQSRIPVVFPGQFPNGFVNNVAGWGCFDRATIEQNEGKLLTLDIDFGRQCSLACPHCFRRNNQADQQSGRDLSYDETCDIILQGKELGLCAVKFLGAGEPFEAPRILDFLAFLHDQGITPSVFTKGHVLGNEKLAQRHFGLSCESLVARLNELGVSILLGFNSFDPAVQDEMVGKVTGYTEIRNRALSLLINAGFNKYVPGQPTRLCIGTNPVTNQNLKEIFPIYTWARRRNIYVVVCPTMVSGKCRDDSWSAITPSEDQLVDLYTQIYRWNLETGLQTLDQIQFEGIAAYAGGQPCNQVAYGMYVTLNGTVLRCPGDDTTVFGDVRRDKLADIWHACENNRRSGTFNCGCPPKIGKSFPTCLFQRVLSNLG